MDIIFWRHAEAEDSAEGAADLDRKLTKKGRRQAKQVGSWLRPRLPANCRILASPASRTRETATGLGMAFELEPSIGPAATAEDLLGAAKRHESAGAVLLVGHQPCIGEAIRALLSRPGVRTAGAGLSVRKGAIWWIRIDEGSIHDRAQVSVRLVLAPEFLD